MLMIAYPDLKNCRAQKAASSAYDDSETAAGAFSFVSAPRPTPTREKRIHDSLMTPNPIVPG
jgi:hypothetical protein